MTSLSPVFDRPSVRVQFARHPEAGGAAIAGATWIFLIAQHWSHHDAVVTTWRFSPADWSLMVVAMMVPGVLPMMRRVGFVSLRSHRHRAPLVFAASYASVWILTGVLAAVLLGVASAAGAGPFQPSKALTIAVLLGAALWQLTPAKKQFLRDRHRDRPIAPRGWAATRSLVALGFDHARTCAGSCWAIMAAMFVAGHDLHLMVPLSVIMLSERWMRVPRPAVGAAALVATALASALASALG